MGNVKGRATCRVVGEEEVEVPAGKYKAALVYMEIQMEGAPKNIYLSWFAADVGMVKQIMHLAQPPSIGYLGFSGTRTIGLIGSPLAGGPFLAASTCPPFIQTNTMVLEKFEEGK